MARRGASMQRESPYSLEAWASMVDVTDCDGDGPAIQGAKRPKKKVYLSAHALKEGQRQARSAHEKRVAGLLGTGEKRDLALRKHGAYDPNHAFSATGEGSNLDGLDGLLNGGQLHRLLLLLRDIEEDNLSFEAMIQRCMAGATEGDFELDGDLLDARIAHPRRTIHDLPRPEDTVDHTFPDDVEADDYFREQAEEDDMDALAMPIADLLYLIKAMRIHLAEDETLTTHNTEKRPPLINKQVLMEANNRLSEATSKMVGVNQIMEDGLRASNRLAERVSALTKRRTDDYENKTRRLAREIDFLQAQLREASSSTADDAERMGAKLQEIESDFEQKLKAEAELCDKKTQEFEKKLQDARTENERLKGLMRTQQEKLKDFEKLKDIALEHDRTIEALKKQIADADKAAARAAKQLTTLEEEKAATALAHESAVAGLQQQVAEAEAQGAALLAASAEVVAPPPPPDTADKDTQTRDKDGRWDRVGDEEAEARRLSAERKAAAAAAAAQAGRGQRGDAKMVAGLRTALEAQERSLMEWEEYLTACTHDPAELQTRELLECLAPPVDPMPKPLWQEGHWGEELDEEDAAAKREERLGEIIATKMGGYIESYFDASVANIIELTGRIHLGLSGTDPLGAAVGAERLPEGVRKALGLGSGDVVETFVLLSRGAKSVKTEAIVKMLVGKGVALDEASEFVRGRWVGQDTVTKDDFCAALGENVLERLGSHVRLSKRGLLHSAARSKPPTSPEEQAALCKVLKKKLVKAHGSVPLAFEAVAARGVDVGVPYAESVPGTPMDAALASPTSAFDAASPHGKKKSGRRGLKKGPSALAPSPEGTALMRHIDTALQQAGAAPADAAQFIEWIVAVKGTAVHELPFNDFVDAFDANFSALESPAGSPLARIRSMRVPVSTDGALPSAPSFAHRPLTKENANSLSRARLPTTQELRAMISALATDTLQKITRAKKDLHLMLRRDLLSPAFRKLAKPTPPPQPTQVVAVAERPPTDSRGVQTVVLRMTTAGAQTVATEDGPFSGFAPGAWRKVEALDLDATAAQLVSAKGAVPRTALPLQVQQLRVLVYWLHVQDAPPGLDAELGEDIAPAKVLHHLLDDIREITKKVYGKERARVLANSGQSEFLLRQQAKDKKQAARLKALADRMTAERDRQYEAGFEGSGDEAEVMVKKPALAKAGKAARAARMFLGGVSDAPEGTPELPEVEAPPPVQSTPAEREMHLAMNLHKLLKGGLSLDVPPLDHADPPTLSPRRAPSTLKSRLVNRPAAQKSDDGGSSWSKARAMPQQAKALNHARMAATLGLGSGASSHASAFVATLAGRQGGAAAAAKPSRTGHRIAGMLPSLSS